MWPYVAGFIGGLLAAGMAAAGESYWRRRRRTKWIPQELQRFFRVKDSSRLQVLQKSFPRHMAPDAKRGLDQWLAEQGLAARLVGVPITESFINTTGLSALMAPQGESWYQVSSVEYESFDVGGDAPMECPKHALWLLDGGDAKLALFWTYGTHRVGCNWVERLRIEAGFVMDSPGSGLADQVLARLEEAVHSGHAYRGQVLSLGGEDDYRGNASGVTVHRLRPVARQEIILPEPTLALLERNVVRFAEQRPRLRKFGMSTRKGLLFYGPPGTGKTHSIHYLINVLQGHTTLLITAEQIGSITEYMTLARLLEPCLVVIEDVDLIARRRDESGVGEQCLLNRLLNEMDGLRPDSAITFVLTTNRPDALEAALAARPGRIDQAIEFPLPDAAGREQLIKLYASGASIAPEVVASAVRQTEAVSASFIKELMRRAVQFHLECRPDAESAIILQNDVDQAIEEMLWSGGPLNRALLGAGEGREQP
ncbi:MAG: cell division protein FtsH [Planctomycetota bacterium]|nr:MAG: cell division protein FtsH [Planctomycetota bacterium]